MRNSVRHGIYFCVNRPPSHTRSYILGGCCLYAAYNKYATARATSQYHQNESHTPHTEMHTHARTWISASTWTAWLGACAMHTAPGEISSRNSRIQNTIRQHEIYVRINRYGRKKKHTHTQRHKHTDRETPRENRRLFAPAKVILMTVKCICLDTKNRALMRKHTYKV